MWGMLIVAAAAAVSNSTHHILYSVSLFECLLYNACIDNYSRGVPMNGSSVSLALSSAPAVSSDPLSHLYI